MATLVGVDIRAYKLVKTLLDAGADPNGVGLTGQIFVHDAVMNNCKETVQLLLAAGSDPNVVNHCGVTPLHRAAAFGLDEIAQLLLDARASPNIANQWGSTPLHYAAFNGRDAIAQLLLSAGADPTLRNDEGKTPCQEADIPSRMARTQLLTLLTDAEYVWTHSWNPEEHSRWTKAQRLERVGALSAFRIQPERRTVIPELPLELQFAVFEHL